MPKNKYPVNPARAFALKEKVKEKFGAYGGQKILAKKIGYSERWVNNILNARNGMSSIVENKILEILYKE